MSAPPPASAAGLLQPWVSQQVAELREALEDLSEPENVHTARVRMRRLRSVLGAFEAVVPIGVTELRKELRRLGRSISDLRDLDVIEETLGEGPWHDELADQRGPLVIAAAEMVAEDRTGKVLVLLDVLSGPTTWNATRSPAAAVPAERIAREVVAGEIRRVLDRVDAGEDHHQVRKAAKRLRYCAEVAAAVVPGAEKTAKLAEQLQDLVGGELDEVMTARWLEAYAAGAGETEATRARARAEELHSTPSPAGPGYDDLVEALRDRIPYTEI